MDEVVAVDDEDCLVERLRRTCSFDYVENVVLIECVEHVEVEFKLHVEVPFISTLPEESETRTP